MSETFQSEEKLPPKKTLVAGGRHGGNLRKRHAIDGVRPEPDVAIGLLVANNDLWDILKAEDFPNCIHGTNTVIICTYFRWNRSLHV